MRIISRFLAIAFTVVVTSAALVLIPQVVDSVAYLAGFGGTEIFVATRAPISNVNCAPGPCTDETETPGILEPSHVAVDWPGSLPIGYRALVRKPVWSYGPLGATALTPTTGSAIAVLCECLLIDAIAAVSCWWLFDLARQRRGGWYRV
jgi:hypothetical protein